MLDRIKQAFNHPGYPSAVVVLGPFGSYIDFLHVTPEDGTVDRVHCTQMSPFRYAGAKEQAREQIGTVCFYSEGNGDTKTAFFDDVETRASKLYNKTYNNSNNHKDRRSISDSENLTGGVGTADELVKKVLKPAVLGAIRDREGKGRGNKGHTRNDFSSKEKENANDSKLPKEHPVYIIYVQRSRPEQLITSDHLTSFPRR